MAKAEGSQTGEEASAIVASNRVSQFVYLTNAADVGGGGPIVDALANISRQKFSNIIITQVTTSTTTLAYTAFPSTACTSLDIVNTAAGAVDIEYWRNAGGFAINIPAGSSRMVYVVANASEIGIRRRDGGTAAVVVGAEAFVI